MPSFQHYFLYLQVLSFENEFATFIPSWIVCDTKYLNVILMRVCVCGNWYVCVYIVDTREWTPLCLKYVVETMKMLIIIFFHVLCKIIRLIMMVFFINSILNVSEFHEHLMNCLIVSVIINTWLYGHYHMLIFRGLNCVSSFWKGIYHGIIKKWKVYSNLIYRWK